jgi:hypothetical protein
MQRHVIRAAELVGPRHVITVQTNGQVDNEGGQSKVGGQSFAGNHFPCISAPHLTPHPGTSVCWKSIRWHDATKATHLHHQPPCWVDP